MTDQPNHKKFDPTEEMEEIFSDLRQRLIDLEEDQTQQAADWFALSKLTRVSISDLTRMKPDEIARLVKVAKEEGAPKYVNKRWILARINRTHESTINTWIKKRGFPPAMITNKNPHLWLYSEVIDWVSVNEPDLLPRFQEHLE